MDSFSAQELLKIPPPISLHSDYDPGSPPGSILLDPYGYLSSRTNGTTAGAFTRDGRTILVTFWVASPPRASYFTFDCCDFQPSMNGNLPKAVYSEDDLVLFRFPIVTISRRDEDQCPLYSEDNHYFVYQAGTKNRLPSLHLVAVPHHVEFGDRGAVLLRCRDQDMFYLALLHRVYGFNYDDDEQYDLHLYNSKTGGWNTKLTHIDYSPKEYFEFAYPNAVLTIGGESGSVAWVNLWRGILICHLLLPDNHILRYIPLPVPKPPGGFALYSRNMMVFGDHIKFLEMFRPSCDSGRTCGTQDLVAARKKMKISDIGSGNIWEEDCAVNISEIPVESLEFAQMLPSLKQVTDTKVTLKRLHAGYPALSFQDADVVYIMQTPVPDEDKAVMIAVDMKNKTIKDVAYFGSGRYISYHHTYLQSGISKYLDIWSSSRSWEKADATSEDHLSS
ncbi:uncharacterized protein LOC100834259 [Brachypodium distachyon]|uniref:DUF1618 domain-containing protein n=1 Tax=Brachypodium distachyon TaxID=15368 RepID=I1GTD2_BRADI|nr:uncharacterized protein LOC100834259 [Brachypodium distachyon]KQK15704.1 hypothetical protein BRADI_1g24471v3 [Brachypodium distachyon]|eukprot:XP_003560079.1 uncharacterized protein LOC100834259 [Brachypodium distachyon]